MTEPGPGENNTEHNLEVASELVVGGIMLLTILAYACAALAVLGGLWFLFSRLVL